MSASCNPMDCSPPGSSLHGISQARILKWVAFPSPGDLTSQGANLHLLNWQADSLPLSHQGSPLGKTYWRAYIKWVEQRNVYSTEKKRMRTQDHLRGVPWGWQGLRDLSVWVTKEPRPRNLHACFPPPRTVQKVHSYKKWKDPSSLDEAVSIVAVWTYNGRGSNKNDTDYPSSLLW